MEWTKQFGRYIVVMLLQVLLFNQLQLWGICHPYIYILCLMMMPITLPLSVEMIIGAIAGLIMDVFCNWYPHGGMYSTDVHSPILIGSYCE